MRTLHFSIGLLTLAVFLLTGQFMRHHNPPLSTLTDSARLLFRSRHIYILAGALVNLMLGLYLQRRSRGIPKVVQTLGSSLLTVSPALLILAFAIESKRAFQNEMWWSSAGLYALFAGCLLHVFSAIGDRR